MNSKLFHLLFWTFFSSAVFGANLPVNNTAETLSKVLAELEKEAQEGNTQAMFELGEAYFYGKAKLAKDGQQAKKWFEKAAEQGHPLAMYQLGNLYSQDLKGIKKDNKKATTWFGKCAELNQALCQYKLGYAYQNGIGIGKDLPQAIVWYQKAAEHGYGLAMFQLAELYNQGSEELQKNKKLANEWFFKCANLNHALCQYSLGYNYQTGQGTKKDYPQAAFWYEKAASNGFPAAMHTLGLLYLYGGTDFQQDKEKGNDWLKKCADLGYQECQEDR